MAILAGVRGRGDRWSRRELFRWETAKISLRAGVWAWVSLRPADGRDSADLARADLQPRAAFQPPGETPGGRGLQIDALLLRKH